MRRFLRFFDWRLFLTATVFLTVVFLVISGVRTQHDDAVKAQRISQLVTYTQQQAAEFKANRDALILDQGLLLTYTRQLAVREDALLAYLRDHGIQIPTKLITEIPPPKLVYLTSGGGAGPTTKPSQRRSPAVSPSSAKKHHKQHKH